MQFIKNLNDVPEIISFIDKIIFIPFAYVEADTDESIASELHTDVTVQFSDKLEFFLRI